MRKALAVLLTFALMITLLPIYSTPQTASAAGVYFLFPNENDIRDNARKVSTSTIQLEGTINGVVGTSISYNVKQITNTIEEKVLNSTEEITTGIFTTGNNQISISNIALFPGMNKITFKGVAGASTVSESIYIEFRDSPMLYDLKITFENKDYELKEDQPTMLYSTAPKVPNVPSQGQIVITGKAPNATKVNVDINGRNYDFNVSTTSNNNRFSTSQLTLDKGMNIIKFRVYNGSQVVETTRQVAYYDGDVTYYDLVVMEGTTAIDLESNADILTGSVDNLKIEGKAIIPLPLHDLNNNPNDLIDLTVPGAAESALMSMMSLEIDGLAASPTSITPTVLTGVPSIIDVDETKFIEVGFSYNLPNGTLQFDKLYKMRFIAPNYGNNDVSSDVQFTLRDDTKSYIYDINYLSGFDETMFTIDGSDNAVAVNTSRIFSLNGTDIPANGVDVYSVPMGMELLIGNYSSLNTSQLLNGIKLATAANAATNVDYKVIVESGTNPLTQVVTKTVNNEQVSFLRVFVMIQKLPKSGTNTLQFNLDSSVVTNATNAIKSVIIRLLYGPYMKFDKIVNGMSVNFDTVNETNNDLLQKLGAFQGQLFNIVNQGEIVYQPTTNTVQSVFMYINNVEIKLEQQAQMPPTKFKLHQSVTTDMVTNILNKAGTNTIKFVFISNGNLYENIITFNIVPTNLPVVPAPNTDGVYPYTLSSWPPIANDPNFVKQGSVYTTREAQYNVYGTFDFIDLGKTKSQVDTNLSGTRINKDEYIVTIDSPEWDTTVTWNLDDQLRLVNGRELVEPPLMANNSNGDPKTPDADIEFYYDMTKENFFFRILNQEMPVDGSTMVYVITVFNAGVNGPRATYRLEVNPISIPYSIKSPVVEQRVTNKNFVEVIISSPGADSITVDKVLAEKVTFRDYSGDTETPVEAFRAVVKDLRPNRETEIDFTITRGEDTINQVLTVKYVPTNIPGAQIMETMAKKHKLFNNALTLEFEKSTQLIRPGYNDPNKHATQVYNGNDILFAIANPDDGIVDRHPYESDPPNYAANSQAEGNLHIGYRFQDQARQFIKASPLFWVDAGLADDPDPLSEKYDPITTGLDPFPFPNVIGKYEGSFASRWNQFGRELIPSEPGELTITYDSNIVQSAGTTITVFRFDPYNSTWENIGGVVDDRKRTVTVPFTKFGYYVAVKLTRGFNDITDHPYAREAMEAIFSKGIMNAVDPIGMFGGDRYVTRGEFTRMIVRAMDLQLNYAGEHHFTYYPETITNANNASAIYDYRYIETAARAGIVNGKRPGFFDEDVELTRQEAATILARALQLKLETDSEKAKKALDKVFKDSGSFDFYSIPSVIAIQKKGFIQGKLINQENPKEGSVFEPRARLLRSDAAIIMARVMKDMKKLPPIYN
ncbi:S-layer homology domain-containing protein [Paenibacillus sp. J5C_2022]|uniref:S-layer homology domain-containing protein n=1 Tax=Paenibacillus sp. J5C2022 TaxID=2977129 RepID=UPI0021D20C55|nr:S-layer homology domain-containing protein [Paenibacillus sp. J5C2022]MCU6708462.1 S-layer homology domain-containing protein [Paenibacillus sp. J5C2022]